MSTYPRNKLSELIGVTVLAAALLLSLSLISYDALDPSLNVSAPGRGYANYVGKVGAWTSDAVFQLLGFSAFLLPLVLVLAGFRKLRGHDIEFRNFKVAAILVGGLALCGIISLTVQTDVMDSVNYTPGGVVGLILAQALLPYLNMAGSVIVLTSLLILSVLITTNLSLGGTLDRAGDKFRRSLTYPFRRVWQRIHSYRSSWGVTSNPTKRKAISAKILDLQAEAEPMAQFPPKVDKSAAPPVLEPVLEEEIVHPLHANQGSGQPFRLPSLDFLKSSPQDSRIDEDALVERARLLSAKCAEFGVHGRVLQIHPGPVVTTFEFKPDPGVKYSRITTLTDDLCLALKAESVRIDRIAGKNTVGVEVPNQKRQTIFLKEILSSATFHQTDTLLPLALGKMINGSTYVSDLTRMPHLLIAGATGAGKSVGLNSMVCSILYKSTPQEVRFIMIDPKRLELGLYHGIPHLLTPIVTDPKQAANALSWAVREMEERYKLLAKKGVRDIQSYNRRLEEDSDSEETAPLPYIVIIVDELADLMMTSGKDVEVSLTRLAQMARAIGIHLILATQRPSVDVLTGIIKANFPSRISFRVSSKVDSRTILDTIGSEKLLGQGDMLFLPPGSSRILRLHGPFVTDKEIARVTGFLREQSEPQYQEEILDGLEGVLDGPVDLSELEDEFYDQAARFVVSTGKASTSLLQRRFRIGYGRAARLLDMMEHENLIGPPDGTKPREVLVGSNYFEEIDATTLLEGQ